MPLKICSITLTNGTKAQLKPCMQRHTPSTSHRAELDQYPLLVKIEKRAIKFWQRLKTSEPASGHFRALKNQEVNIEESPLSQLVLRLQRDTNHTNMSNRKNRTLTTLT